MLPGHVLKGSVDPDANFSIPAARSLRLELIAVYEEYLRSSEISKPGNEKLRTTLCARLQALRAFEGVMATLSAKK